MAGFFGSFLDGVDIKRFDSLGLVLSLLGQTPFLESFCVALRAHQFGFVAVVISLSEGRVLAEVLV